MRHGKREKQSNNKTFLSIVLLIILMILVLSGTIAWLTKTSSVSNIFTVGSFENPTTSPTDPETPISIDGNIYEPSWNAEEEHKLIPAATFEKDPYVGIGTGSEDASVYVYVENSFSNKVYFTINEGWEAVEATKGFKSDSVGFCFFDESEIDIKQAIHFLSGLVSFDICAVFETDKNNLKQGYGVYKKNCKQGKQKSRPFFMYFHLFFLFFVLRLAKVFIFAE